MKMNNIEATPLMRQACFQAEAALALAIQAVDDLLHEDGAALEHLELVAGFMSVQARPTPLSRSEMALTPSASPTVNESKVRCSTRSSKQEASGPKPANENPAAPTAGFVEGI